jgi:alpha-L-fucosidase
MPKTDLLETPGDTSWFVKERFGLFIHWGLYALPARHEWVKAIERLSEEQYDLYFKYFDPDLYDPNVWAEAAAHAGMKYFVVTTKHHEGFCLWDSKHTDYKATKTPAGRDLLRPMVKAFNDRNLRTGFYHSLIDWHHPDYVVDYSFHPRRDELPPNPEIERTGWIMRDPKGDGSINDGRDQKRYAEYLRRQVRELLTEYGQVDVLWFDFSYPDGKRRLDFTRGKGREAWESDQLYQMIRELQPKVILTDRLDLDLPLSGGDMKTPEQVQPRGWVHIEHEGKQVPVVWEACQTFSGSWGYHRDESSWRSTGELVRTLIDSVSKGGNFLLNVGPTGRGEFDERALDRLRGIGDWMRRHSRSIYGCTEAPEAFEAPRDCRLTYNAETERLFVHVFAWPYKDVHLDGAAFAERVEYAQLLNDASEVKMSRFGGQSGGAERGLTLHLPQVQPNAVVPVVELFLKKQA